MTQQRAYLMDCMEGMKQYPDKYFELAIVDPPYGIGIGTSVGGASHSVVVGGANLSRPKSTRDLTTHKSQTKNTLKNYSG
jgi:DNA modification methylase